MNRKEFGRLISVLRKERFRTASEFAFAVDAEFQISKSDAETNEFINENMIAKLESGGSVKLTPELVNCIATALGLLIFERRELFYAVNGFGNRFAYKKQMTEREQAIHSKMIRDELTTILNAMVMPSFLTDNYGDIVACNIQAPIFLDIDVDQLLKNRQILGKSNIDPNLMEIVYDPESKFLDLVGEIKSQYAISNMMTFRTMSLRYRHHKYFRDLYNRLTKIPQFNTYWRQTSHSNNDYHTEAERFKYKNRRFGFVDYVVNSSISITPLGDLHLFVYAPTNQDTLKIFQEIYMGVQNQKTKVLQLANWPKTQEQMSWDS